MENTGEEVSTLENETQTERASVDFLAGLTPLDEFSDGIHKHPKTVRRMRPPIVHIGRTPYVPTELGRKWVLDGCPPVLPEAPRRQRRVAR